MSEFTYRGSDAEGEKRSGFVPGNPFGFAVAWHDAGGHWLSIYDETGAEVAGVQNLGRGHYEAWTLS